MTSTDTASPRPRVVIIGAGFGGLSAAKQLARAPFDVTIVDRHNYHLFQPLLYQVATAGLSPGDIASPTRGILSRQKNAKVILAKVSDIDIARSEVIAEGRRIPFDYLIVATGAEHAYFGHDWSSYAPGLKTIDDATYLRRRILLAFERAESEPDADERRRLLNFVVVGGGPTGVEMSGAIAELAKRAHRPALRADHSRRGRAAAACAVCSIVVGGGTTFVGAARRGSPPRGRRDALRLHQGFARPRAHRNAHHHVGRGCQGVARSRVAGRRQRSRRPRTGASRSFSAGTPEHFRDRRCRRCERPGRQAFARCCTRCEAAGAVRRESADGARQGQDAAGVCLSRLRRHGHDRTKACGCTGRGVQAVRRMGMAPLEPRVHLFLDRFAQPSGCRHELVLELRYVSAWYPIDHRHLGFTHRRCVAGGDDGAGDSCRARTFPRRSTAPTPACP